MPEGIASRATAYRQPLSGRRLIDARHMQVAPISGKIGAIVAGLDVAAGLDSRTVATLSLIHI